MKRSLDLLDVKILEELGEHGPRNVSKIARELTIPVETARKRINRLVSRFSLSFHANVYHTNIGLKKAFIFADAVPGYEKTLFNCLKANDFWLYISRYYGRREGCYGIYGIPEEHIQKFGEFLDKLKETKIAENLQMFWSTCLHTINLAENWFDPISKSWTFRWNEWIDEIPTQKTKLPKTLRDPQEFPIKADLTDMLILTELEVDFAASFRDIAKTINATPETVAYHYKNHILKNDLLEKPQVFFLRFDKETSNFFVFLFTFHNKNKMGQFAISLLRKPFVHTAGKIIGKNSLVAHMYLPNKEFRRFIDSLSKLVRKGLLATYEYVIEDFNARKSQTISSEYFKEGSWIYNHKKHLSKLSEVMKNAAHAQKVET